MAIYVLRIILAGSILIENQKPIFVNNEKITRYYLTLIGIRVF